MTAPAGPRAGRSLAAINPTDWTFQYLYGTFERPIDVAYNALDDRVYVVDFGQFEMNADNSLTATPGSGRLFRYRAE